MYSYVLFVEPSHPSFELSLAGADDGVGSGTRVNVLSIYKELNNRLGHNDDTTPRYTITLTKSFENNQRPMKFFFLKDNP